MIFIWHGYGWLALLSVGLFYGLFEAIITPTMGKTPASQSAIAGLAYICSAIPCWFLEVFLRRKSNTQFVTNPQTGQQVRVKQPYHALFFIPLRFWAPIFFVLGIYLLITSFTKLH